MSRYIDADALVIDYYDDYETKDDEYTYAYVSKSQIDSAPSIDIVRCKECKYAEVADPTDHEDGYTCQFHRGSIWFSGSYCSYGEREGE